MNPLEDKSLAVIKYIDNILQASDDGSKLINVSPSELADNLGDFEKKIEEVESNVSMLVAHSQNLCQLYLSAFDLLKDTRNDFMLQINKRKNADIPINSLGTLYDEEKLLKEISVLYDSYNDSMSIENVRVDEIIDMKEYSYTNIIKKMDMDSLLLNDLITISKQLLATLANDMIKYNQSLMELKNLINNPETVSDLMSDDCDDELDTPSQTKTSIKTLWNTHPDLSKYRKHVIKLFQIYNDLTRNYEIYGDAVERYVSSVLESCFSIDIPYELC